MKSRIWMMGVGLCLALGGAAPSLAANTYYVNDTYVPGADIYTTRVGNDINSGRLPDAPKLTLASVLTNAMGPGDVIYIDTGTYGPVTIPGTVSGAAGNRILFQGSTNFAAGGSVFTGSGNILVVSGDHLAVRDVRVQGGQAGLYIDGADHGLFEGIWAQGSSVNSGGIYNAKSNMFRRCVFRQSTGTAFGFATSSRDNQVENCVAYSQAGSAFGSQSQPVSNVVGCVFFGAQAMGSYPSRGERNILFGSSRISTEFETLSDLQRSQPNWTGNSAIDPKFANADALDFHLLSVTGYATNGSLAVTNVSLVHSPAIDFGAASASVGAEPAPNGGRVNIGLYGGTAEASKSRTNAWLFAMSFNDGGTLMQTGRLEWVASTNYAGKQVKLQYSTNNGAPWSDIATVEATNETHTWIPAFSNPAVLWRVVSTNGAVASTNAKPFSIRTRTNTTFTFYVNDGSPANDVYCNALGDNANSGGASNAPKRSLQAILDAYQLRGGDVVYVDTGDYTTNLTTTIGVFDSGTPGNPVRIVGSPNGSVFARGSASSDTLDLSGASDLEIENLRLTDGRYGLNGGLDNIVLRNVQFTGNQQGAYVTGSRHVFDRCLSAGNSQRAFSGFGGGSNQWRNGVMWGGQTLIHVNSNKTLTVSNSILGNGTTLFGSEVAPGDHNVVWDVRVAEDYPTFSAFQNAGLGLGWERSLYADPLFANAAAGDFHLKSASGRYDPALGRFATNVLEGYSPAIDLGDPLAAYALEPAPNGSRLNAGLHGNTAQASKSRTSAWLQLLSYTDGGRLDAQAETWLRWDGGQFAPGAKVTIWLSRDGGSNWVALATGVAATNGAYRYQELVPDDSSSFEGRLKVELEGASPAVASQSPTNFTYLNGTFSYYVNDGSTNGSVYCTAPGNDANSGMSASKPKANLHQLLKDYGGLGPGDRVYVDTGVYTATNPIALTAFFSGTTGAPVRIIGSTNRLAGGSVFKSEGQARPLGFDFQANASNIVLRDVIVSNAVRGVAINNASRIQLENVEVRGATGRAFELTGVNTRNIELTRCVAHRGAVGIHLSQATNVAIRHGVFWENSQSGIETATGVGLLVENSLLAATGIGASLYNVASMSGFSSDYNGLHAGPFTRVGMHAGGVADNLAAWQAMTGRQRDLHSVPGDPQMADPDRYDYHLKTEQTLGRLLPNGDRTSDLVSSPLLDAGDPASTAWTNEPAPNGRRVDIGRFGGTAEASSAVDSPWLKALSFGDAGSVTNGNVLLYWLAGGGFSNQTAKVEVSVDGGKTWGTTVASGIPITNGVAPWTVSGLPDTPGGAWRVVCLQRTNLTARSTNFFSIRNQPLNLFVATADTNDAVYVTGPGAADNWMASSNAPIDSLRTAFERFDLEPGDRIWVDPGTYAETDPIAIRLKNSGLATNPVQIIGNVFAPYRGPVLARAARTGGSSVFQISRAGGVRMEALTISNAWTGVQMEYSDKVVLERVRAGHCVTNAIFAGAGATVDLHRVVVEQNLVSGVQIETGSVVRVQHSLFRDNARANVYFHGGNASVKNSILEAAGASRYVYYMGGTGTLEADYNNIRVSEGGSVAGSPSRADRFLIDWQRSSGFARDKSSFGYEAEFANAAAYDFHLKSASGRYLPTGVWTNDATSSKLIDLGDPSAPFANEPTNNGGRVNVGLYGNTAEASKSSGQGRLVPLTMSDGGTISGVAQLFWAWNGMPGNERVNVQFSADGGSTWTNIATNIDVNVGTSTNGLTWDTSTFPSTAMGVWRILTTNAPPIVGQTETLFALRNASLSYYVNDGSTNGDIYCSAVGRAANTGLETNSPIDSLTRLFGRYKVEHGDVVYVDTGVYPRGEPLTIAIQAVAPSNHLIIQGSTNEAAGGSVFTNASGTVLDLQGSQKVELRDLRLHGGSGGLRLTQSSDNRFVRIQAMGTRGVAFDVGEECDQNRFIQCAAINFSSTGFHVATPLNPLTAPATNHWINGVISSVPADSNGTAVATGALMSAQSGRIYVSNSVFVANGPAHIVYAAASSVISGDYNCFHRPFTNSLFARIAGTAMPTYGVGSTPLAHLGAWAAWNSSDSNSLAADPLFADLAGGDLHPRSAGGRYVPEEGGFVPDEETSPLIDAADPLLPFDQEPGNNGGRANLGTYGNDPRASQTPTNGAYVLLTLNEGGVARGTQTLKWLARGAATNSAGTLNIQVSTNSGFTWPTIATIPASARQYEWNSSNQPSVPTARWRVRHVQNASWDASSSRDFLIHNTNLTYYVNDASTNQDIYCSAAGSPANTGLSPQSPLSSLADVLSRWDLEPGDQVLIDTGEYASDAEAVVGFLDCGEAGNPVRLVGSTNEPGTVFRGMGLRIENARGISARNLRFRAQGFSANAATIERSEDISLEEVDMFGAFGNGVSVVRGSNVYLRNFSVAGAMTNGVTSEASFNTRLAFGVIWSNGAGQVSTRNQERFQATVPALEASSLSVSNCVLGAFGVRNPAYEIRGTLYADYNNLYLSGGALAALSYESGFGREFDSVGSWSSATNQDARSLSHDPRFADAVSGDFHLKSSRGRHDPATGGFVEVDPASENSPLIDAGAPTIACVEPLPNGGRVNIGRHGNTAQASKTPTNGAIALISFNDGGRASGADAVVTWLVRGSMTNAGVTVKISYSADGGATWTVLATGIQASLGAWTWNTTASQQSVQGKLKIEEERPNGAVAVSDKLFSVRNAPFRFYINDGSRTNDVYCSAPGDDANSGLASNKPMATLKKLLETYDLASGTNGADIVYIDTGVYKEQEPWRITQADSAGDLGLPPVVFQGSTHSLLNGTVVDRRLSPSGIQLEYAVGVRLRNITVSNMVGGSAVTFNNCHDVAAENVAVGNGNIGFQINGGSQIRVANSLVLNDCYRGVVIPASGTPSTNAVFPVIENNVFWETAGPSIQIEGSEQATVRNNILSVKPGHYVYDLGSSAQLLADYNALWLGSGGRVFRRTLSSTISPVPIIYETVGAWAAAFGQDLHSYDGDPLLANPAQRDFHLKSRAGRHVGGLIWTNDAVSSPLIDAGWPGSVAWTNETTNNGGRINIGLYGGTPGASRSDTNSMLHLLTLNRGGVASNAVALNWKASGASTGHTVRLEASLDDGRSWFRIVNGIAASSGGIVWNSSGQASSPLARWRVMDEVQTNVIGSSELNFVLHNGPIHYYVNDDFRSNDIYCSAVGSSTNTGVATNSPKRWVSEILDLYNLEPGDVIHVDTGIYQTSEPTVIGDLDAGGISQDPDRQVTILGCTNALAGESQFIMTDPDASAFELRSTYGIRFKQLSLQNGRSGLSIQDSFCVAVEWLNIRGCENGLNIQSSSNVVVSRSAMAGNRSAGIYFWGANKESMDVGASVLWSNRYGIYLARGYVRASNSIFGMTQPNSVGYYVHADRPMTELKGDYNSLHVPLDGGAVGALQSGEDASSRTSVYATVSAWTLATGQDAHSLPQNPQLADPGIGDFHLKSAGGRFKQGAPGPVYDTVTSPLIDAGDPQSMAWTAEPDPNGRQLNIGRYGGTAEASRTPSGGNVNPLYPGEGARVAGDVELKWSVIGAATNYTVRIEYSGDDGVTWTNIVTGWPASTRSYPWNSRPYGRSALSWWRITCHENTTISAQAGRFILDNLGSIPYYVNDASTNGDVYCTAPGNNANNGLTPARPKATLQAILETYQLANADIVHVDAGTYSAGSPPIQFDATQSGKRVWTGSEWSNLYVSVQGSTNPLAPTVFESPSRQASCVFFLNYAVNVRLTNLTIRGAKSGVMSFQAIGCELDSLRIEDNELAGVTLNRSENCRLVRSVLLRNGAANADGVAVSLDETSLAVENCVLWGSPGSVSGRGTFTVTNSVLDASGANGRIYRFPLGGLAGFRGDYNCYSRKNGALIAEQPQPTGGADYYNDLPVWSAASLSDSHSQTVPATALTNVFANAEGGDFHLRSPAGRFADGSWTNDAVLSPLVDTGAPPWPSDREPEPNGGIINIGAYGNTPQASKTPTNPPWMRAISLNDGGVVSSNVLLYWGYGGMPGAALVRVEYSTDYQGSWVPIASNLPANSRQLTWNVSAMPLSLAVYWRVVFQANPTVWDACDQPFSVKTRNFDYFVNDASTNGDVWCSQPGRESNSGTNAASPVDSLQTLLSRNPVGGGDRIFIDTGDYSVTGDSRIILDDRNTGSAEFPLIIYGSTNSRQGGAIFRGDGAADGIKIQNARYIRLHDIRVTGARNGVALENVDAVRMKGMELFRNQAHGLQVVRSSDLEVRNSRLWANRQFGYSADSHKGLQVLHNSTLWGNRFGAAWNNQGQLTVSNSILAATNSAAIYTESAMGEVVGDYNLFGKPAGGVMASNLKNQVTFSDLRHWQEGRDAHSFVADPLFVDPAEGNFHLQSRRGYWNNGTVPWPVSTNTSWGIDGGDPASDVAAEPPPNEGRINLGAYGGTPEASLSDTNSPALLPITLRDGGVAPDGQPLHWLYRGISPTNTVRLEYSPDNGLTWITIAGGIRINEQPYIWTSAWEPSPLALWRVVLESNPALFGVVPNTFIFRPKPLTYYVNDASTNNDVYCTAVGSFANLGYTPNSPLPSVQEVLRRFQLLGGDQIKVDTGVYALSEPILITSKHKGDSTNQVKLTGSTNWLAGGSRLEPTVGMMEPAFVLYNARNVDLSWFHVLGFTNAVAFQGESPSRCNLMDLDIQGSSGAGITMTLATGIRMDRVLIREGENTGIFAVNSQFAMDGCVLWSNRSSAMSFGQGVELGMTNSVVDASGLGNFCYYAVTGTSIRADYNDLYIRGGAQIASIQGLQYEKLPQWIAGVTQDVRSLSVDPLFRDPANGDFHLRSVAGRYQPGAGWTNDVPDLSTNIPRTNHFSRLIDMGSPRTAWSNEPSPHGSRRNIGLHGNTVQASKSNTNRWLQAVTAMGGGIMQGGVNLVWGYGSAIASNEVVWLWYSYDNATSDDWQYIGESAVGAGQLWWQSDKLKPDGEFVYPTSPAGRWRIELKNDSSVMDMTPVYFGLRNSPFTYYLNDTSTNNDVYTTSVGSDGNLGFYPAAPKLTLQALLEAVDLEATDRVFIDTGIYRMNETNLPWRTDTNTPIVWDASDGGKEGPNQAVVVRGSHHPDGSHFVATNRFSTGGFFFLNASFVDMRDLWFAGESIQIAGEGLTVSNLVLTNGSMRVASDGAVFENVRVDRGAFSLSGQGTRVKLMQQRWGEADIVGTNVTMLNSVVYTTNAMRTGLVVNANSAVISNCTVVSANGTALGKRGPGTLRLGHSILVAGGPDPSCAIAWENGGLISDWNNLWAQGASTWLGGRNGRWEKLAYWQAASGQDANSVSFDPLFQNPGAGDFHLNSQRGRWSPFFNSWQTDGEHSPLIDLGNPEIAAEEPSMPNGDRRNLGAYGGTTNASLSREEFWLTALTQNDGGVLKGPNVVLRWRAGNANGKLVTLQYSANDGVSWTDIATHISATDGSYVWDTTGFADSFTARWRVVAEDGSGVSDGISSSFSLRNQPANFYVNDGSRVGDLYCSVTGRSTYSGLATNLPKQNLQQILDAYDLEGGDRIYLDTGTYASTSDVRIIWSRGGDSNADVVIQGNTNHAYGTRLTRTGSAGFPAAGINVKASHVQLAHMAIQGVDRGILLESNRHATVRGVVARDAATAGVAVEGAQDTQIRNSGFWNVGWGVSLNNTQTSVLENLTFVLPAWAGIRLNNTAIDTLQNNLFVPAAGAYAYAIGTATSLLTSATMDYNLYDFSSQDSGFHEGATNDLRRWQLRMNRDFRSARTNALLADIDGNNDFQFHPLSQYGRWTAGGWTLDASTSWAVDHGNPNQSYALEPTNHGSRLNIGMYGNTVQASKGSTNIDYAVRTLNDGERIQQTDSIWPLIWSTHLVGTNEWVQVRFSSDGGSNWIVLATVPAYQEYFIFQATPQYQTVKGIWQVVGVNDPGRWANSASNFTIRWGQFKIRTSPRPVSGLMRFDWEGGVGGFRYRIEYSDDFGKTWNQWDAKYNGPAVINKSNFVIPAGETATSYPFEDRTSYLRRTRWYRMWELPQ